MKFGRIFIRSCFICINIQAYFGITFTKNETNHVSTTNQPEENRISTTEHPENQLTTTKESAKNNISTKTQLEENHISSIKQSEKNHISTTKPADSIDRRHSPEMTTEVQVPHQQSSAQTNVYLQTLNKEYLPIDPDIGERIITDMSIYCPNADICNKNGSKIVQREKLSCCESCSCDKACGEQLNCCFPSLDTSKIVHKKEMTCVKPVQPRRHKTLIYIQNYYMVDKCLNDTRGNCKEIELTNWESVIPVYAPSTGMIYYNKRCAECNGISDVIEWDVYATCNPAQILDPDVLITNRHDESCEIEFVPPENADADIDKYRCYDEVIDRCNMTGDWHEDDPFLWQACASLHAPDFFGGRHFANVFCKICNGEKHFIEDTCPTPWVRGSFANTLTMTLDWGIVRKSSEEVITRSMLADTNNRQCSAFEVKHPNKAGCRPLICPVGSMRSNDVCKLYATTWYVNGYKVHVEMSPISKELLPVSAFDYLTTRQQRNFKSWFQSKVLLFDHIELYAEIVKVENITYANKLTAIVGRQEFPINASKTLQAIELALSQRWEIRLNGKRYLYDVKFDNYTYFIFNGKNRRRSPDFFNKTNFENSRHETAAPIRVSSLFGREIMFGSAFYITKMFFCKQVELLPDEWIGLWREEIQLNLTKNEIGKILGNGQFSVFENQAGNKGVRICVEDFIPNYYNGEAVSAAHIVCFMHEMVFVLLSFSIVNFTAVP